MPMPRPEAAAYVARQLGAVATPTLSPDELEAVLDANRCVDDLDLPPGAPGYIEHVWATHAVVDAYTVLIAKVTHLVDFSADGTSVSQSQLRANLVADRASWAAQALWGTP